MTVKQETKLVKVVVSERILENGGAKRADLRALGTDYLKSEAGKEVIRRINGKR